jgi:hypothetical protein
MKKITTILLLTLIMNISIAQAFSYSDSLDLQVDLIENVELNSNNSIVLFKDEVELKGLSVAPNYVDERKMFLNTREGLYFNLDYDANFISADVDWPEEFVTGPINIKFAKNYSNLGNILAYNSGKIFISYDRNNTWSGIPLTINEEILFAELGPNFSLQSLIYFITDSGLYFKDLGAGGQINTVLESELNAKITDFNYATGIATSSEYYVVKGNKILKTYNAGNDWLEEEFTEGIKQFEVIPDGDKGDLAVITENNKFYYAASGLNFFEITIPAEITEIKMLRYVQEGFDSPAMVILTDQGFYISYDNGNGWGKLDYGLENQVVQDFSIVKNGSQYIMFAILDNQLYRDVNLSKTFDLYMNGIDTTGAYATSGIVESQNVLDLYEDKFAENLEVTGGMLVVEEELNDQVIKYSLTADGANWMEVMPNETIVFQNPGRNLKWKAELSTSDTQKTPVLLNVLVDFGLDEIPGTTVPIEYCAGYLDVPIDHPQCNAITYVTEQGIFEGYPDGRFLLDQPINRAETVKVVVEVFNIPTLAEDGTNLGFSDVIIGEYYMKYLKTAKERGIIQGYPDLTFKPEQTVNYIEMLKIFFEAAEVPLMDEAGAQWYEKYLNYARANNLVPYENIVAGMKRGDVAQLFYEYSLL